MKNHLIIPTFFAVCSLTLAARADSSASPEESSTRKVIFSRITHTDEGSERAMTWAASMEKKLADQSNSPNAATLKEALQDAKAEHAKKEAEVGKLHQELNELKDAVNQEKIHDAEIEKKIAESQEKLENAKKDLAAAAKLESELLRKLQQGNSAGVSDGVAAGNRKSVAVAIRGNLLAPVASPYFGGRSIRYTDGDLGVEISAVQDGVPLGEALGPGGWLAKALEQNSPADNYVCIIVTPDSIPTYYALLKELRTRKYLHTWTTWDGKPFQIITSYAPGHSGAGTSAVLAQ